MRRKGITLVELLVVMVIVALSAGGIFFAYRSLVRETIRQSLFAKNEQDVEVLLTSLRKDLQGIGFGVPVNRLNVGTLACNRPNRLTDFASSNSVVGLALNCLSGNDELYFLNLATRSLRNSGCWWVRDGSRNVATEGRRWTLENCPNNLPDNPPAGENLLCLDMASRAIANCNLPNTLIFTMGDRTSINDFAVRYYLSNTNLPKECAPGTFNLLKQVNGDAAQPIASCVAVFRVRYFDGQSYNTTIGDINNLRAVRLCLLMQVGGRMDTSMNPPDRFEQCGNITINSTINNEWRWYRWKLVEEDIPLRNIRR